MRHLTSTDLEELEARLRTERDIVLDAIRARLAGQGQAQHRELIDGLVRGDRAAIGLLGAAELALLRPELAGLEAIDTALKRIDFGVGALCILCGDPLPLECLREAPATLSCDECRQRAGMAQPPPRHAAA